MRLLFLTPQLPYPSHQGASLRNWAFIRELSSRHDVHLLCFRFQDEDTIVDAVDVIVDHVASLTIIPAPSRSAITRLVQLVTTMTPDLALRLWTQAFADALDDLLAQYDIDLVQVEGLELLYYAEPYLGAEKPAWVYDAHNAEADLQESAWRSDAAARRPHRWIGAFYSYIQWQKLRRYERRLLPRFAGVVSVSDADAESLVASTGVQPLVLPNGVDTEELAPGLFSPAADLTGAPSIVFTGKMDFRPNIDGVVWFVTDIWPRVRAEHPDAKFWIVGQKPAPAVRELAAIEGVVVTGRVPTIEPYIAGADVVVAPLRMGSGTRLKVLQAMSMARPVVGTSLGCSGLGVVNGEHVRIADSPERFATAVSVVLRRPEAAAEMAQCGRRYVRERFDWQVLVPRLETLYERIVIGR